jgi:hypothetical protein
MEHITQQPQAAATSDPQQQHIFPLRTTSRTTLSVATSTRNRHALPPSIATKSSRAVVNGIDGLEASPISPTTSANVLERDPRMPVDTYLNNLEREWHSEDSYAETEGGGRRSSASWQMRGILEAEFGSEGAEDDEHRRSDGSCGGATYLRPRDDPRRMGVVFRGNELSGPLAIPEEGNMREVDLEAEGKRTWAQRLSSGVSARWRVAGRKVKRMSSVVWTWRKESERKDSHKDSKEESTLGSLGPAAALEGSGSGSGGKSVGGSKAAVEHVENVMGPSREASGSGDVRMQSTDSSAPVASASSPLPGEATPVNTLQRAIPKSASLPEPFEDEDDADRDPDYGANANRDDGGPIERFHTALSTAVPSSSCVGTELVRHPEPLASAPVRPQPVRTITRQPLYEGGPLVTLPQRSQIIESHLARALREGRFNPEKLNATFEKAHGNRVPNTPNLEYIAPYLWRRDIERQQETLTKRVKEAEYAFLYDPRESKAARRCRATSTATGTGEPERKRDQLRRIFSRKSLSVVENPLVSFQNTMDKRRVRTKSEGWNNNNPELRPLSWYGHEEEFELAGASQAVLENAVPRLRRHTTAIGENGKPLLEVRR